MGPIHRKYKYTGTYIHMIIYMHRFLHVCLSICICGFMSKNIYICECIYVYTHVYVTEMNVYVFIGTYN